MNLFTKINIFIFFIMMPFEFFFLLFEENIFFLAYFFLFRCHLFTRLRQRFKQNVAPSCLVKKKTGFTIHGPRLLLRLERRVNRSNFLLLLLQLGYNIVHNDTPCKNTEKGFNQLFSFSFSFSFLLSYFFCTMSPLFCNVNNGDSSVHIEEQWRHGLPLPFLLLLLLLHHVSTVLLRE